MRRVAIAGLLVVVAACSSPVAASAPPSQPPAVTPSPTTAPAPSASTATTAIPADWLAHMCAARTLVGEAIGADPYDAPKLRRAVDELGAVDWKPGAAAVVALLEAIDNNLDVAVDQANGDSSKAVDDSMAGLTSMTAHGDAMTKLELSYGTGPLCDRQ